MFLFRHLCKCTLTACCSWCYFLQAVLQAWCGCQSPSKQLLWKVQQASKFWETGCFSVPLCGCTTGGTSFHWDHGQNPRNSAHTWTAIQPHLFPSTPLPPLPPLFFLCPFHYFVFPQLTFLNLLFKSQTTAWELSVTVKFFEKAS